MNRKFAQLMIIAFLGLSLGCSTDFELEAPWKDIPIVYGFLSVQDADHYIRVEKAFLESGGDASSIARIPDSIYYDASVNVFLERTNTGQRFPLERIDGNSISLTRDIGPFAESPNILYTISDQDLELRGGEPIRLVIDRGPNQELVTAETTVLEDVFIREMNPVSPVNMAYDRQINFVWNVGEAAQIFEVQLLIHYLEKNQQTGEEIRKTLPWVLAKDLEREGAEGRISLTISGESFFQFLGESITASPFVNRTFIDFDLEVLAGGQEFVDIKTIAEANNGITSAQFIPLYSNLSEGRGVFSSRSKAIRESLSLTPISFDSLRNGRYTRDLGF